MIEFRETGGGGSQNVKDPVKAGGGGNEKGLEAHLQRKENSHAVKMSRTSLMEGKALGQGLKNRSLPRPYGGRE